MKQEMSDWVLDLTREYEFTFKVDPEQLRDFLQFINQAEAEIYLRWWWGKLSLMEQAEILYPKEEWQ